MGNYIYADNAATTKITDRVFDVMLPFLKDSFGNPSSVYSLGRTAKRAIEDARRNVAEAIGAKPNEIYFTSGGTEADNWAIKGYANEMKSRGKDHIITSVIEHHAVLHTCESLEKQGFKVTYLPVNNEGFISIEDLKSAIKETTGLITIMYANNEIGTIQPIKEIGEICRDNKIIFHTDAVQAVGNVEIDVVDQKIDLLSISGHKIHTPKGVGALYARSGTPLKAYIEGGGQEKKRRGGTENVAGIVALGQAIMDATANIPLHMLTVAKMRDRLIEELTKLPYSHLNGGTKNRLCGNVNISFEAVEGEALLLTLDMDGICGSSGSACTSGDLDPSHVLLAIGRSHEVAHGSLRLSINELNTDEEIEKIIQTVPGVIDRLRAMSPIWDGSKPIYS